MNDGSEYLDNSSAKIFYNILNLRLSDKICKFCNFRNQLCSRMSRFWDLFQCVQTLICGWILTPDQKMHLMGYKHCLHSLHLMSRNFFVRLYNSRFATEAPVIFFRFQSNIWGSSAYSYLSNKRSSTIILFDSHIHCASFGTF